MQFSPSQVTADVQKIFFHHIPHGRHNTVCTFFIWWVLFDVFFKMVKGQVIISCEQLLYYEVIQEYITLKQRGVQPHTYARISKYMLAWVGYMATSLIKIDLPK